MKITELAKYLNDEEAATDLIESIRWTEGRICPHCSSKDSYRLKVANVKRRRYKCADCRKQFTVSVGTIFEDSHIPFGKWIYAIYQMCIAKKGVSANQLKRELGITYKSAWFMCHRIRYAMTQHPVAEKLSGIIEIDETYVGGKPRKWGKKSGYGRGTKKQPVVSLIQRDGDARSFVVDNVYNTTLQGLACDNIEVTSYIMTDKFRSYIGLNKKFASHESVDHSKEYARGIVHTNFAESYFSLLKRGIVGTFHHISKDHMQGYLGEFDFRWNNRNQDIKSSVSKAILGFEGKRLTYRRTDNQET